MEGAQQDVTECYDDAVREVRMRFTNFFHRYLEKKYIWTLGNTPIRSRRWITYTQAVNIRIQTVATAKPVLGSNYGVRLASSIPTALPEEDLTRVLGHPRAIVETLPRLTFRCSWTSACKIALEAVSSALPHSHKGPRHRTSTACPTPGQLSCLSRKAETVDKHKCRQPRQTVVVVETSKMGLRCVWVQPKYSVKIITSYFLFH